MLAADVGASWGPLGLASFYVPGERVTCTPQVKNFGDTLLTGTVTLQVFLTTDGTIGVNDVPVINRTGLKVTLQPGAALTRNESFTLPLDLEPGGYVLVSRVLPGGTPDQDQGNNTSENPLNLQWRFGYFGGRQNVTLRLQDDDGTIATFTAGKDSNGVLTPNMTSGFDLAYLAAGSSSGGVSAKVSAKGGDGFFDITNLTITGNTNSFDAKGLRLRGDGLVNNQISKLILGEVIGPSTLELLSSLRSPELRLGFVQDLAVNSAAGLKLIDVDCWRQVDVIDSNSLIAPFLVKGVSRCQWQPAMILSSTSGGKSLGSLTVPGEIGGEFWKTAGRVGTVKAGSVLGTNMNIGGALDSLSTSGNINGATIAAVSIGTLNVGTILGGIIDSKILAGTSLGFNDQLDSPPGTIDDQFNEGTIKTITVKGEVTNSIIAAGVNPNAGTYLDGLATLVGEGEIQKITIGGVVSNTSRIMARFMPATAKLNNVTTSILRDVRFMLPDFVAPVPRALLGTAGVRGSFNTYEFTVIFNDAVSLDTDTIRSTDLQITGPGGFTGTALFVTGTINGNGDRVTAIYEIAPPGGSWDSSENGIYTVAIAGNSVKDLAGNAVAAGTLGQFEIRVAELLPGPDAPNQGTHAMSVVDGNGVIHMTFLDDDQLAYRRVNTDGTITVIDLAGGYARGAIALLSNNAPVIVGLIGDQLTRFTWTGSDFDAEVLANFTFPIGENVTALSIAIDTLDQLHVAYSIGRAPGQAADQQRIYRLFQTSAGQTPTTDIVSLDTGIAQVGTQEVAVRSLQIATDAQNRAHVIWTLSYFDNNNGTSPLRPASQLMYATDAGGAFGSFALPLVVKGLNPGKVSGDAGVGATIAIRPTDNRPYIASQYIDRDSKGAATKSSLLYHTLNQAGTQWSSVTVASSSAGFKGSGERGTGALPVLRFTPAGQAQIAYADYTTVKVGGVTRSVVGQIRHAVLGNDNKWTSTTVFSQSGPASNSITNISFTIRNGRTVFTGDADTLLNANTRARQFLVTELVA